MRVLGPHSRLPSFLSFVSLSGYCLFVNQVSPLSAYLTAGWVKFRKECGKHLEDEKSQNNSRRKGG